MQVLSKRLETVLDLVPSGARVADIGTDHAYLSIALMKSGKARSVIACDVNEKPLENAKQNIAKTRVSGITLRLSDGLANIGCDEADCIVIAGMGGEVISGIIERCSYLKNAGHLLILQPMTGAVMLRSFLNENGFKIIDERGVREDNRAYTVICAVFSKDTIKQEDSYFWHGELNPKRAEDNFYLQKQIRIISDCINDLKGLPQKDELYRQYCLLYQKISEYINGVRRV